VRRLLSHLRANTIAYLALFVALGGTAYAATSLQPGSVGTKELKNSAVTSKKIKRGAVTSAKVRDRTLKGQDFAPGVLLQGPTGATGPTGGVDTTILYAVVRAGDSTTPASIAHGKHAVSVTRTSQGVHEVKFDRDVTACAAEVSFGGIDPIVSPGFSNIPSIIRTERKGGAPDTLIVAANSAGQPLPAGIDSNFHLLVAC